MLTLVIVGLTYIGIAFGRIPKFRTNRTTISLIGVSFLVVFKFVTIQEFADYIDMDTIILLFAMMIINANLRLAGFFQLAANQLIKFARSPRIMLLSVIFLSASLSAIFLNDTICLMLTPFIIDLTQTLKRNPIPYLIALATAANIGSTATLTGNPQNMIIGIASGINYLDFLKSLAPIAILGSFSVFFILVLLYPEEFKKQLFDIQVDHKVRIYKPLLSKSLIVISGLLVAFLVGIPVSTAAFVAAAILLITRRLSPNKVFAEFDWSLLVFFSSLFILTGVLNNTGLIQSLFSNWNLADRVNPANLTISSAILSNLVSNVPAVLLMKQVISQLSNPIPAWLTLASAASLAGNFTLLGSVANLIVSETAQNRNVNLSFWEYTRAGFLITIITLIIHWIWITIFVW
jgi:Na+/H+ antiporter NhaD/arsenite permease-like protein